MALYATGTVTSKKADTYDMSESGGPKGTSFQVQVLDADVEPAQLFWVKIQEAQYHTVSRGDVVTFPVKLPPNVKATVDGPITGAAMGSAPAS